MTDHAHLHRNEFTNGLAVFVLQAKPTGWHHAAVMVVIASTAAEARALAFTYARRQGREPLTKARRWENPERSTCRRASAGHPHVIALGGPRDA